MADNKKRPTVFILLLILLLTGGKYFIPGVRRFPKQLIRSGLLAGFYTISGELVNNPVLKQLTEKQRKYCFVLSMISGSAAF